SAVRAGLRILDEHRATLGATDLRAHASGHRVELVELGLRMAMAEGSLARVFAWAEHGRASHLMLRPARPPDDPELAQWLAELRSTAAEIYRQRIAGRGVARLVQRQVALERTIRDYMRRQRHSSAVMPLAQPVRPADLAPALGETALVEYVALDEKLYAISIVDGRARLRAVGEVSAVRALVDRIAFTLRRVGHRYASEASRSAASTLLRQSARALDTVVVRSIADEVQDRPLLVIPTGPLQSVPWSILPSCSGRPVTVAPSAALWWQANRDAPDAGSRVAVVGYGLPGAVSEAIAVAALHRTDPLLGADATVDAVTEAMSGAGLAHLATHGMVRPQNPLFSSLVLEDGPLTVYDLERLAGVPQMVILAACDSGRTVVRAGDELLGISATLLSRGAQQVVASVVPVPDVETAPVMVAFHEALVAGQPAPRALADAQQKIATDGGAAMAAAAGFVCVGAAYTMPGRP
ncbi:MAG TPA: CHAT domain-containing protein, partial [Micromonosporaceae bacterium]